MMSVEPAAATAGLLEYATPVGRDPWGPIVFKPSRRSLVLMLLTAGAIAWLALRHEPWRLVAVVPADYRTDPLFTDDGRMLTFDTSFGVNLVDPATGATVRNVIPKIETGPLRYFVLNGGRQILALPWTGPTGMLYDVGSGRVIERLPNPDRLGSLLVAVAPDGPRIISARQDRTRPGKVQWWDLSEKPVPTPKDLSHLGEFVGFSPDGRRLLMKQSDALGINYRLVDVDDFRVGTLLLFLFGDTRVEAGFARNCLWILAYRPFQAPELCLFDTESGRSLRSRYLLGVGTSVGVFGAAVSDDAQLVASVSYGSLSVHDTVTGGLVRRRAISTFPWARFFPGAHRLLVPDGDVDRPAVVDPDHHQPLAILPPPPPSGGTGGIPTIAPDGQTIAYSIGSKEAELAIFRRAGWDCRESSLGALVFPQTWLVIVLLTLSTFSLVGDARRGRGGVATRPPARTLVVLLIAVTLPLTVDFVVHACLGQWKVTPAPLLLLAAVGLVGHGRAWRLVTLLMLSGLFPVLLWVAHRAYKAGLKGQYRQLMLDRYYDVPQFVPFVLLAALAVGAGVGIYLLARPGRVG